MKAIIFDVDGVLLKDKDEFGNYLWSKNTEADLGLSSDQIRLIYSGNWDSVLKGIIDTQQYFKSMFQKLNIHLSVDEFIEYWILKDSTVNTEILPVIESIMGPKLYIGTNQESLRTKFLQEKFEPYFDGFFSSCQIGAIKAEPKFFKYIESTLNIQPSDIAFIDDSKSHVEVAKKLGWTCHHYQNIDELKNFIKKL